MSKFHEQSLKGVSLEKVRVYVYQVKKNKRKKWEA
jgi:hypothetical protein